jgi:hypothetical protein
MPVQNRIQVRRGTAAAGANQWTTQVLYAGEIGFETDTGKFKIGDGTAAWNSLTYAAVLPSDLTESIQDVIGTNLVGTSGIAVSYNDSTGNTTLSLSDPTIQVADITDLTVSAAEINVLDGITSSTTELNYVDIITLGTVQASKAVTADSNKDITSIRNLTASGTIAATTNMTINGSDVATKAYADSLFGANDAMIFKGTIGTGGTVTALPTTYSAGWTYRVITAATYAGVVCEVGDLIIAVVDRSGSGNLNSDWTVAQTNIDGAVLTTRTITAGAGLTGGGDLSANRTLDVGAGDGITVGADSVAVDSTVVRTTGAQYIYGLKQFDQYAEFSSSGVNATISIGDALGASARGAGIFNGTSDPIAIQQYSALGALIHYGYGGGTSADPKITVLASNGYVGIGSTSPSTILHVAGSITTQAAATTSTVTQIPVFVADPASTARTMVTRTPSGLKSDIGLGNVENTALSTWAGSSNITTLGTISTGTWSASTIAVNKGGTGATTLTGILLGNGTSAFTTLTSSTACQVLVRNSANTGYEFSSTLCGLTIDGGTP